MKKLLIALTFVFIACTSTHAQLIQLVEQSHYYPKMGLPGQTVRFQLRVQNMDDIAGLVYAGVLLTSENRITFELYPPAGATIILAHDRVTLNLDITLPDTEATYSVTFLVFDAFTDTRLLSASGQRPFMIGTPGQELNVHPSRVNFGNLPYGRFMYPIPFKVRYKMFLPNNMGDPTPWSIRIYTDNANKFKGLTGTVRRLSPAGLVHSSGKYTIPIKFWNLNWGPDAHSTGWDAAIQGPPPVEDDQYWKGVLTDESTPDKPIHDHDLKPWLSIHDYSDMTTDPHTWRRTVGMFPYDGQFLNPTNTVGDFQLSRPPNPFEFYIAVQIDETAVQGKYSGRLVLELFAP